MNRIPLFVASLDAAGGGPADDGREDHAAVISRLLRFVEQRRIELEAAGESTADARALLEKLRRGLDVARRHPPR